jgi:lipopolysaccharide transport system ATP-binding protein
VGDIYFQQKCATRIRQLLDNGVTMLFVSHDLAAVEALCDRVMLLDHGKVRHIGDKAVGIRMYYAVTGAGGKSDKVTRGQGDKVKEATENSVEQHVLSDHLVTPSPCHLVTSASPDLPWQSPDERDRIGDGRIRITGVCWRREDGGNEPVVEQNGWLELFAQFEATADVGPVNFGITFFDRLNRLIFARGWINADVEPLMLKAGERITARFKVKLDVELGEYSVALAASEALRDPASANGWNQAVGGDRYAELPHASRLAVLPRKDGRRLSYGLANLANEVFQVSSSNAPS